MNELPPAPRRPHTSWFAIPIAGLTVLQFFIHSTSLSWVVMAASTVLLLVMFTEITRYQSASNQWTRDVDAIYRANIDRAVEDAIRHFKEGAA